MGTWGVELEACTTRSEDEDVPDFLVTPAPVEEVNLVVILEAFILFCTKEPSVRALSTIRFDGVHERVARANNRKHRL